MKKRLPLVLLVVAVAAVLGFLLLRGGGKQGAKHGTAVAASERDSASGASSSAAGANGRAIADPRTKTRGSIAGTIRVKDGGGPLAGASVCSAWSAEGATADDTREPVCTKTDAAGAYKLTELVPGYHRVQAFAAHHVPAAWRDAERRRDGVRLKPGEQRTGVDLELAPGGVEIAGVVEDVSGGPVADAFVSVRSSSGGWWSNGARAYTRSDAQGHFSLWTKQGEVAIYAEAEGYAAGNTEAVAPTTTVEVLLTPESVLAGVVVETGSKTPIEGAIVSVGDWRSGEEDSDSSARTDAQGHFRLTRLSPGRYKPTANAQGRYGEPGESVLLGLGQSVEDVVIEVHAAATVRGTVVVDEGNGKTKPCPEAWVSMQDERAGRWEGDSSDEDGKIEITSLLPGKYDVEVWCEGYLAQDKYDAIEVATADIDGVVWKVGTGGRIAGVVKTASGTPVPDANVSAQTTGGAARGQRSWGGDETRADGTFLLKGLVAGDYTLDVNATGHRQPEDPPKATVPPGGGETKVEITLPESGTISGTVVDTDGKPVRNARARVANDGWSWGGGEGRTGDDGMFTIEGVRPGERRVVATRGWWNEMRKPGTSDDDVQGERVTVAAGKTATVKLVVEARNGVITGSVTDEKGEPVVDAWVLASRESDAAGSLAGSAARDTRWSWGRDDRPVITGVDGTFKVTELTPGTYAVRAFRRGGGEAVGEHVKVGGSVKLVIRSTGLISGTVKTTDNGPLPDEIHISVVDEKTGFSRREKFFRTGGVFTMRDLPAGSFLLTGDSSAGRVQTPVELKSGESKVGVVLTLERKVTVKGRMVELGTTTPVPGLQARVQPVKGGRGQMIVFGGGGSDKEHISGEDGRFTIENAPTGKAWLTAWPMDWESSPWAWTRVYVEVAQADVVDVGDIEVIKRRKKKPNDKGGDFGFTTVDQPPDIDPTLSTMKVAHVRPGGPAARTGLVVGDVIVSVDGHDVRGVHASRAYVLMDVDGGTQVTFGLERGESVKITAGPPL
ncbi:MAG TPA: carboxypeptidase regulatory-like domain-containing protein [Kofleriaceae bacterium]|nr:carboxypeptidase regulatory-like domain-containing protein [Kofleriaceae bacterium]